jgi:hypothetical protein
VLDQFLLLFGKTFLLQRNLEWIVWWRQRLAVSKVTVLMYKTCTQWHVSFLRVKFVQEELSQQLL